MKQSVAMKGLACVAALTLASYAWADTNTSSPATTDSPWKISIGPGAYFAPEYPGARHMKVYPFPSLDISYRDRFFSQGPDVLGVNVISAENYHVGASLSFDFQSRTVSDDPHLHGLSNVDDGPKLRLFADYTLWAFTGAVAMYQDISGHGQGTTATADLYVSLPLTGWLFSVGPGLTWANGVYTRTLFGVTPDESAASGLPAYSPGAGIRDLHMTFYMTHDFSKHWVGSVNATFGRLQHYAADSPITESRREITAFAGLNYRF